MVKDNDATIKYITLDCNRPIGAGVLPACLSELNFGDAFNHKIDASVLPKHVKSLAVVWILFQSAAWFDCAA